MNIDLSSLSPKEIYFTMIQCIVPRPIAWVLSDNGDGSHNLAPFSYFNGVCSKPPILSISVGKKRDGTKKDTWKNIEERSHFVVHLARSNQAADVSATAASLPFGTSEVTENQLAVTQDSQWSLPRLVEAPIAMLCRLHQVIEVGETPQGLILGQIEQIHVADSVIAESGETGIKLDPSALDPLARLGGDDYAGIGQAFTVDRPE